VDHPGFRINDFQKYNIYQDALELAILKLFEEWELHKDTNKKVHVFLFDY
jgi:hypothetical protein